MATHRSAITFNPATVSVFTASLYGLYDKSHITNYVSIGPHIGNIPLVKDPLTYIQERVGLVAPGRTKYVYIGTHTKWHKYHSIDLMIDYIKP